MLISSVVALQAHAKDTQPVNTSAVRHGLSITIEHPAGTVRKLHDDNGNQVYTRRMWHDYGYFNKTKGRDGDEVDCFLGPIKDAQEVYIVHMLDHGPVKDEREDEDKCFVGFPSADAAKTAFLLHYPVDFYGGMTSLPVDTFKKKLKTASLPYRNKKITGGFAGGRLTTKEIKREPMDDIIDQSIRVNNRLPLKVQNPQHNKITGSSKVCPKCKSKNLWLMPTDFETAKCKDCGHMFQIDAATPTAKSVHYTPIASNPKTTCQHCSYFRPLGSRCSLLKIQVKPGGWCDEFKKKSIEAGGPGSGRHKLGSAENETAQAVKATQQYNEKPTTANSFAAGTAHERAAKAHYAAFRQARQTGDSAGAAEHLNAGDMHRENALWHYQKARKLG